MRKTWGRSSQQTLRQRGSLYFECLEQRLALDHSPAFFALETGTFPSAGEAVARPVVEQATATLSRQLTTGPLQWHAATTPNFTQETPLDTGQTQHVNVMPALVVGSDGGTPFQSAVFSGGLPLVTFEAHPISLTPRLVDSTQAVSISRIDMRLAPTGWFVVDLGNRVDMDSGFVIFDRTTMPGSSSAQARHELATASSAQLRIGAPAEADELDLQEGFVGGLNPAGASYVGPSTMANGPTPAAMPTQTATLVSVAAARSGPPLLATPTGADVRTPLTAGSPFHSAILAFHSATDRASDESNSSQQTGSQRTAEATEIAARWGAYLPTSTVHFVLSSIVNGARASIEAMAGTDDGARDRVDMLASVALNTAALDQAIENLIDDVEQLGGGMVSWLEDFELPAGSVTATTIAAAAVGAALAVRMRYRLTRDEELAAASSKWLFTHIQCTTTQP